MNSCTFNVGGAHRYYTFNFDIIEFNRIIWNLCISEIVYFSIRGLGSLTLSRRLNLARHNFVILRVRMHNKSAGSTFLKVNAWI